MPVIGTARELSALPPAVAETVRLVLAHDAPALVSRIRYQQRPCNGPADDGLGGTPCETGETPGTIVPAFLLEGCDGSFQRPDQTPSFVERGLDSAVALYAAYRGTQAPGEPVQTVLLFTISGPAAGYGVRVYSNDDGTFDALVGTCNGIQAAIEDQHEFIIRPARAAATPTSTRTP
jgi:hypothetical protein